MFDTIGCEELHNYERDALMRAELLAEFLAAQVRLGLATSHHTMQCGFGLCGSGSTTRGSGGRNCETSCGWVDWRTSWT